MGDGGAVRARVYGIGVGPGDPELITLKALRLLTTAPVIAYPATETGESVARQIVAPHLVGGQREIPIPIPIQSGPFPDEGVYDRAAEEILAVVAGGEDVVVLCEGDPFFYGSFLYLYARLADRCPVEVVPGVSSLMACAAVLGAPLAARNDVLAVLPATLDEATLRSRIAAADGVALIKVGRHLAKVRGILEDLGLAEGARYIERATMTRQRLLPLAEAPAPAPYFSMVLVHRRGEAWR